MATKTKRLKHVKISQAVNSEEHIVEAIDDVKTGLAVLAIILAFLASFSLPGLLNTLLQDQLELTGSRKDTILSNIALTAPLTLGFLLVFWSIYKNWFTNGYWYLFFSSAVLASSSLLFHPGGRSLVSKVINNTHGGNLFTSVLVQLFLEYYQLYHWNGFLSAFIIAIFLVWAIDKLLKAKWKLEN